MNPICLRLHEEFKIILNPTIPDPLNKLEDIGSMDNIYCHSFLPRIDGEQHCCRTSYTERNLRCHWFYQTIQRRRRQHWRKDFAKHRRQFSIAKFSKFCTSTAICYNGQNKNCVKIGPSCKRNYKLDSGVLIIYFPFTDRNAVETDVFWCSPQAWSASNIVLSLNPRKWSQQTENTAHWCLRFIYQWTICPTFGWL